MITGRKLLLYSLFFILGLIVGGGVTFLVTRKKEAPTLPMPREQREQLEKILHNIEKYDGTSGGQEDI